MKLRYLSLFSGIEAATVAWKPLGWEAVAFAQYEPGDNIQFPSKVLQHHYPDVPNLGDVTKITEEQVKALGHIDLVVGGSPCQDLSVAGLRRGLVNKDGSLTRSGLFDYQMQIFEWARRNNGCEWMLWENVPGAFSSNEGNDFGYILGSMVQRDVPVPKDGWKNSGVCVSESGDRIVEWRVLDAQYFGVPQRRRRVFALLRAGAWGGDPPVLFESESMRRDSEKSERKGEGPTSSLGENPSGNGCCTLDTSDQNLVKNQDDMAIVSKVFIKGTRPHSKDEAPTWKEGTVVNTLNTFDLGETRCNELVCESKKVLPKALKETLGNVVMEPCGEDDTLMVSQDTFVNVGDKISLTLRARDYKAPNAICYKETMTYDMKAHHATTESDTVQLTTGNCKGVRGDTPLVMDVVSWKERDRLAPIMNNMIGTLAASDYKGTSFVGYMENPKDEHDS